jgi:CheY-like chemotaxis protein
LGDSSRLQQVVWNLLSNAIKFTPTGGSIEVRVQRAHGNLQICVKDSGQGISAEFLPHIFEHFRQADGTTTRLHGGLGLGLAIVRQLVELHGGSIEAHSLGEGTGCTFTIELPMAPQKRQTVHSSAAGVPIPDDITPIVGTGSLSLQDVRVLLIDDDVDTLQFLGLMLTESQAQVHTCTTVSEGLAALEWFEADVVVSDLAMPGEDGYELISKLRNSSLRASQVPAVALTSYVRVEDRAKALSAGFNMFVAKPVQPGELVAAIANLAEIEH